MPVACALVSASAIWMAQRSASFTGMPWRGISSASGLPATYSMTRKSMPPSLPMSKRVTMLGWFRDEAARAS